jgi:hypothetical protein
MDIKQYQEFSSQKTECNSVWILKPFKDETYLCYVKLSSYRTVNTLRFGYKNQIS